MLNTYHSHLCFFFLSLQGNDKGDQQGDDQVGEDQGSNQDAGKTQDKRAWVTQTSRHSELARKLAARKKKRNDALKDVRKTAQKKSVARSIPKKNTLSGYFEKARVVHSSNLSKNKTKPKTKTAKSRICSDLTGGEKPITLPGSKEASTDANAYGKTDNLNVARRSISTPSPDIPEMPTKWKGLWEGVKSTNNDLAFGKVSSSDGKLPAIAKEVHHQTLTDPRLKKRSLFPRAPLHNHGRGGRTSKQQVHKRSSNIKIRSLFQVHTSKSGPFKQLSGTPSKRHGDDPVTSPWVSKTPKSVQKMKPAVRRKHVSFSNGHQVRSFPAKKPMRKYARKSPKGRRDHNRLPQGMSHWEKVPSVDLLHTPPVLRKKPSKKAQVQPKFKMSAMKKQLNDFRRQKNLEAPNHDGDKRRVDVAEDISKPNSDRNGGNHGGIDDDSFTSGIPFSPILSAKVLKPLHMPFDSTTADEDDTLELSEAARMLDDMAQDDTNQHDQDSVPVELLDKFDRSFDTDLVSVGYGDAPSTPPRENPRDIDDSSNGASSGGSYVFLDTFPKEPKAAEASENEEVDEPLLPMAIVVPSGRIHMGDPKNDYDSDHFSIDSYNEVDSQMFIDDSHGPSGDEEHSDKSLDDSRDSNHTLNEDGNTDAYNDDNDTVGDPVGNDESDETTDDKLDQDAIASANIDDVLDGNNSKSEIPSEREEEIIELSSDNSSDDNTPDRMQDGYNSPNSGTWHYL